MTTIKNKVKRYNVIKNHKEVVATYVNSSQASEVCGLNNAWDKNNVYNVSEVWVEE